MVDGATCWLSLAARRRRLRSCGIDSLRAAYVYGGRSAGRLVGRSVTDWCDEVGPSGCLGSAPDRRLPSAPDTLPQEGIHYPWCRLSAARPRRRSVCRPVCLLVRSAVYWFGQTAAAAADLTPATLVWSVSSLGSGRCTITDRFLVVCRLMSSRFAAPQAIATCHTRLEIDAPCVWV